MSEFVSSKPVERQTPAELRGTALHLGKAFRSPRTAAERRELIAWISAKQQELAK